MALRVFDIDGTILNGDSNDQFFKCLINHGIIQPEYLDFNREAGILFRNGTLNILEYYRYVIRPIAGKTEKDLEELLTDYRENYLKPRVYPKAMSLIEHYKSEGHTVVLADYFISTRVKYDEDGRIFDVYPDFCHQEGKRTRLQSLCRENALSLKDSIGYGDTVNDIPLLETVERAFIVNPGKHSEKLLMTAEKNGWQTILF